MPRLRNPENEGLPHRWRRIRNAFYYQVPELDRHLWGGKYQVRLGATREEADAFFAAAKQRVEFGAQAGTVKLNTRVVFAQQWESLREYAATCGIPLTFLQAMYSSSRAGAEMRNLDFELTPRDLIALALASGGECTVSGISWDYVTKNVRGKRPWSPSLDRIDCEKGYSRENCRLVCVAVNIALSDFGEDVLRRIADGMRNKKRI